MDYEMERTRKIMCFIAGVVVGLIVAVAITHVRIEAIERAIQARMDERYSREAIINDIEAELVDDIAAEVESRVSDAETHLEEVLTDHLYDMLSGAE